MEIFLTLWESARRSCRGGSGTVAGIFAAYLFSSQEFKARDIFKNPVLAKNLRRFAKKGKNEIYLGETAKVFTDFM